MVQVKFTSEDKERREFNCLFRSSDTFDRFDRHYRYAGGANNYSADIVDEYWGNPLGLPVIPANLSGAYSVWSVLYPNSKTTKNMCTELTRRNENS